MKYLKLAIKTAFYTAAAVLLYRLFLLAEHLASTLRGLSH